MSRSAALSMLVARNLPTLGCLAAMGMLIASTLQYPGGTDQSAETVGFRWAENFVCALFQPLALNGAANAARPLAFAALGLLCVCLGVVFFAISRSTTSRWHRSGIEIGGIGMAVYALFVPTVLHHVAVAMGFVFGLCAYLTMGHLLWREGRRGLFGWGVFVLLAKIVSAISYYGDIAYDFLPVLQKVGIAAGLGWVLAVYHRPSTAC
jgi:hypothetical protein